MSDRFASVIVGGMSGAAVGTLNAFNTGIPESARIPVIVGLGTLGMFIGWYWPEDDL